jgi:hypothetical protein
MVRPRPPPVASLAPQARVAALARRPRRQLAPRRCGRRPFAAVVVAVCVALAGAAVDLSADVMIPARVGMAAAALGPASVIPIFGRSRPLRMHPHERSRRRRRLRVRSRCWPCWNPHPNHLALLHRPPVVAPAPVTLAHCPERMVAPVAATALKTVAEGPRTNDSQKRASLPRAETAATIHPSHHCGWSSSVTVIQDRRDAIAGLSLAPDVRPTPGTSVVHLAGKEPQG